jgi:serine/threonine-protein kinase
MSDDRWQRIQAIFEQAVQRDPAECESYLAQACASEPGVREEVDRLLAHDAEAQAAGFLDSDSPANAAAPFALNEIDGKAVEPKLPLGYEYLGELGRGGMGVVYKARQTALGREVALKMVLLGTHGGPEASVRFQKEAKAVARLNHPHIVQVYECGELDGLPYFSMEFVGGGNLAQRIAGTPQPVREVARLVQMLAEAMHYAHECGVLHRDLKPANVLLQRTAGTGDLFPKIADFGLAKRLEPRAAQTQSSVLAGTPRYMAPEQAAGQTWKVGPATDIYALGVILYELLTGRPPFLAETPLATLELVVKQEPVPVSQLRPGIPRDLQTICLKCLRKEPGKRYASAAALAEDLRRYLGGEPILARPVSLVEQIWRWTCRNPRVAGLTAALAVVMVAALAVVTWQWRRAEANFERAEANFQQAEGNLQEAREADQVVIVYLESDLHPHSGMLPTYRNILVPMVKRQQRLLEQRSTDPVLQFDLGYASLLLAIVTQEIGKEKEALELFKQSTALLERVVRQNRDYPDARAQLAQGYFYTAHLKYAIGRLREAFDEHRKALTAWEQLANEDRNSVQFQRNKALSLWAMAHVYMERGQFEEARKHFDQAGAIRGRLVKAKPGEAHLRQHLAYSFHSMGQMHLAEDRPAEALVSLQEACTLRKRLFEGKRRDIWLRYDLARTTIQLGVAYHALGRKEDALRSWNEALMNLEELVRDNDCANDFQRHLAEALLHIGRSRWEAEQDQESLRRLERARDICIKLLNDNPNFVQTQVLLAESYHGIAVAERSMGQQAKAIHSLQEAQKVWKRLVDRHHDIPRLHRGIAKVRLELADKSQSMGTPRLRHSDQYHASSFLGRWALSERAADHRHGPALTGDVLPRRN